MNFFDELSFVWQVVLFLALFLATLVQPLVILILWGYCRRADGHLKKLNEALEELVMLNQKLVGVGPRNPEGPRPPVMREPQRIVLRD